MTDFTYILLSDHRFIKEAKSEISLPSKGITELIIDKYTRILTVPSKLTVDVQPIFTYSLMQAHTTEFSDIGSLSALISKSLKPGLGFRIFLIDASSQFERNRDIEIKLGEQIESEEHPVKLDNPDCAVLLIIRDSSAIFGITEDPESVHAICTIFRPGQSKKDYISRSEGKLEEAIDRFHIDLSAVDTCIDIGAAPGGWTDLMLRNGKRVIAIDKGELEYRRLRRYGQIAIVPEPEDVDKMKKISDTIDSGITVCQSMPGQEFMLIHIKSNFGEETAKTLGRRVEMLLVDSNIHYTESVRCALALASSVRTGGLLVLTLKINNHKPRPAIDYATSVLSVSYGAIAIKKLVKDRRELTLFAKRISS